MSGEGYIDSMRIAKQLLKILAEKKAKASVLEESLHVGRGYLSRCSNGKMRLSVDVLYRMSDILGVDPVKLFKRD